MFVLKIGITRSVNGLMFYCERSVSVVVLRVPDDRVSATYVHHQLLLCATRQARGTQQTWPVT